MKKSIVIIIILELLLIAIVSGFYFGFFDKLTGRAISEHTIGPSAAEQQCMMSCMKCSSPGVGCTGNQQECQTSCNAKKPEATQETSCMESCVLVGCGEFDFSCQSQNQKKCEEQCNMIKEPEAKSKEEQCIRDCVNKESPGLICQAGEGGEKGNEICQRCAKSCEHLYAGPCLDEIKLEEAKKACNTCEHCYGKPIMGDSGEGYECIISIECADSSAEFGDTPGSGEGIISNVGETMGNIVGSISNFFSNLF